jgi:hypothetical protein
MRRRRRKRKRRRRSHLIISHTPWVNMLISLHRLIHRMIIVGSVSIGCRTINDRPATTRLNVLRLLQGIGRNDWSRRSWRNRGLNWEIVPLERAIGTFETFNIESLNFLSDWRSPWTMGV